MSAPYSEQMDEIAARRLIDRTDDATQRLLSTARLQTDSELREPSLLPGWTRARVLAHLARGADAMRLIVVGIRTGRLCARSMIPRSARRSSGFSRRIWPYMASAKSGASCAVRGSRLRAALSPGSCAKWA